MERVADAPTNRQRPLDSAIKAELEENTGTLDGWPTPGGARMHSTGTAQHSTAQHSRKDPKTQRQEKSWKNQTFSVAVEQHTW